MSSGRYSNGNRSVRNCGTIALLLAGGGLWFKSTVETIIF